MPNLPNAEQRTTTISRKHLTRPQKGRVPILRMTGLTTPKPMFSVHTMPGEDIPTIPLDPNLERAIKATGAPWPLIGGQTRALLPGGIQTSRLDVPAYEAFAALVDRNNVEFQDGVLYEFRNHPLWTDERGAWFQADFSPRTGVWLNTGEGEGRISVELAGLAAAGLRLVMASTFDNRPDIS